MQICRMDNPGSAGAALRRSKRLLIKHSEKSLHRAVENGNITALRALLRYSQINALDEIGVTALHVAVKHRKLKIINLLLKRGADASLMNKFMETSFHAAIRSGELKVISVFLRNKVNIDVQDYFKMTALHHAVLSNRLDIAALLLKHRAKTEMYDSQGCSPLLIAIEQRRKGLIRLLLRHGANPNGAYGPETIAFHESLKLNDKQVLKWFLRHGASLSLTNQWGENALHCAVKFSSFHFIQHLLRLRKMDVNVPNGGGRAPLHLTVSYRKETDDYLRVAELLLAHGADINVRNRRGITPLHIAVIKDDIEAVRFFVRKGADVNIRGSFCTPLDCAMSGNSADIVEHFVEQGARLDRNSLSNVLNYLESEADCFRIVMLMMEKGATLGENDYDVDVNLQRFERARDLQTEIDTMKLLELADGVTYFDLLTKRNKPLFKYLCNVNVMRALHTHDYKLLFLHFSSRLEDNCIRGVKHMNMAEEMQEVLFDSLEYKLPSELITKLGDYFNYDDLQEIFYTD